MSRALGLRPVVYSHDSPSTSVLLSILPVGHSLGAGVAALMTLMLRDRQQRGRAAITAISPSTAGHSLGAGVAALMTLMLRDRQQQGRAAITATSPSTAGHSLGAGVAALMTLMLRDRQRRSRVALTSVSGTAANIVVEGGGDGDGDRSKLVSAASSHHSVFPLLPTSCRVHCICIAPPPMLSEGLAEGCSDCVLSLVHGMDFVSRFVSVSGQGGH